MSVRVRFAPSPTGFLHIGGLRTALYNYLFAKHTGGKLILRIEDTDRSRYVEGAIENLIKSLDWAGIEFDEGPHIGGPYGPYLQSQRLEIYQYHARLLVENGSAYYAFDTAEEIENMRKSLEKKGAEQKYDRYNMKNQFTLSENEVEHYLKSGFPYVIRLKVPIESEVKFNDIIRGEVVVSGREIDDQVLLKSDGYPTYHLANVVDDHLMKINYVIRGEEWLPSTPKHILLYEAFGWEKPHFAHLPLLLNPDKTKLSKRQGSVAVEDFIEEGYFRDALINFVALLGWNPTADREIYSLEELIEKFNLEKVNKAGAVFNVEKLKWMNAYYLRNYPDDFLAKELEKYLEKINLLGYDFVYLLNIVKLFKERVTFIKEIPVVADYMFNDPKDFDKDYLKKHWKEGTDQLLCEFIEILKGLDVFNKDTLHDITLEFVNSKNLKLKDIIHPIRLIITGKSAGAGMFETMEVLGKETCIRRLNYFLANKLYQ